MIGIAEILALSWGQAPKRFGKNHIFLMVMQYYTKNTPISIAQGLFET